MAVNIYIKKQERSQTNNWTVYLSEIRTEDQANPKANKRREIIQIRMEINEIETRKTKKESVKPKAGYLKRTTTSINL